MAEITVLHIAIIAGAVAAGVVIGWLVRGSRCAQEKVAVSEGWQLQLEAQRTEHARLLDQNKGLMEQVSQFQASGKDATNRARELSAALKEAFERRDELQRELKEIRSNLEVAVRQRDKLKSDIRDTTARGESVQSELKRRDDKIFRLSRELENWQNRLPPLLQRYRERDEEAVRLEEELQAANERISALENSFDADETRVEASGPESLGDALDASNDPDGQAQTGPTDAASDESDQESTFSDFVDGTETDYDDDVGDDARDIDEHDLVGDEAPDTEQENRDYDLPGFQAMVETDDDAEPWESAAAAEPGEEDAGLREAVADTEADDETSIAEHVCGEDSEAAYDDGDEPDRDFADADEVTGEADAIAVDEEDAEESDPLSATFGGESLADDVGDWGSTTSGGITRMQDHGPGAGRDDLQLIKGIGPAIEKTLNELGIFRFDQIADMSEYDIDRVARRLKGFRTRIYREDWIGQARDLQLHKTAS